MNDSVALLYPIPFPERSRDEHPYSYDPIVVWQQGSRANGTIYSDRLLMWDWNRYNELSKKHFGDESHYWHDRQPQKIQSFLRDWCHDPELILTRISEHCNQASGFPVWCFDYISFKESK